MNYGFKEFDHSGDVGIEITGRCLEEFFHNAALGLFSLMHRRADVRGDVRREVRIEADSLDEVLVDWLSEIITLSASHNEIYGDARISNASECYVDAVLMGSKLDPAKHDLRFEVKAATYHGLRVERSPEGYTGRVIFDL
jgi:SHS2 domain-containing protein